MKKKRHLTQIRRCGTCTACCTALGVEALDKDVTQPCRHVVDSKCGIYNDGRPAVCVEFKCAWLMGRFDSTWRPDRTGIVLGMTMHVAGLGPAVSVHEVWRGSSQTTLAKSIINELAESEPVIVLNEQRRQVLGPRERMLPWMERRRQEAAERGLPAGSVQVEISSGTPAQLAEKGL